MKWIRDTLFTSILSALLPVAAVWAVTTTGACGRESESAGVGGGGSGSGGDGGAGAGGDGGAGAGGAGGGGPTIACKRDDGTDPVFFCTQKAVLEAQHEAAFIKTLGVAQSWDSKTFALDKDANDKPLHDPRDDAAYAASTARYHSRSGIYGDTEVTPTLDADLTALAAILEQELAPPPDDYDGNLYFDLRTTAAGLRYLNIDDQAAKIDAIAETYGAAIFDSHFITLSGADAGAGPGVLGMSSGPGLVDYRPDSVATGVLALLDLAVRHAADEPMKAASWQSAAAASLDYLAARARDPGTGLYFTELTNSEDPVHDALVASPLGADTLQSDVAAAIAFALLRAQDLANKNATALSVVASYAFEQRADDAIAALNGDSGIDGGPMIPALWDKTIGGYYVGFSLATKSVVPGKTTLANALLLAAINRARALKGTPYEMQIATLQLVLTTLTPANSSFLSVVDDQNDYLRQSTSGFQVPTGAGADARANSYFSSSISIAVEALDDLTYGLPTN